ncbi:hypothetical protein [Ralstonia phage RP31]|uniref:Uncharacterized protein n=2 Tax=Ripduovirus RP12 TaxID=2560700 RepID=A0A1L7N0S7_9CAUD|nr:hypothetical protein FDH28_gp098 [Ralstonia phage RP12]BAW19072.1 hypothetical protein [Ralstonia phage RP12]BAW19357.1 hypothetical protein [Ralstonia phage RP31]
MTVEQFPQVFPEGISVKDLKELIKSWPDTDAAGEPVMLWLETAPEMLDILPGSVSLLESAAMFNAAMNGDRSACPEILEAADRLTNESPSTSNDATPYIVLEDADYLPPKSVVGDMPVAGLKAYADALNDTRSIEEAPAKITSFSLERKTFGHGEFGYSISIHVDKLSGYDYMDEDKVRKVVDELNASLKK